MAPRFDWYQATVEAEARQVKSALLSLCDGPGAWEPMTRAPHGYAFGEKLSDSGGQVGMLWWGGMHALPHVVSSGETAQQVSQLLRGEFEHRVTRADSCIDYAEPGAYDRLQVQALEVAKASGVKVGTAGDHLLTLQGRTLYLGASTSVTRLRLYDKAAELRVKLKGEALETIPDELARLECQVRPQGREAKVAASRASPVELMGSAAWMRELMRRVAGLELEPFDARPVWRESDDLRAYSALLAQYGGLLRRQMADLGGWAEVGLQLGDDLARL